MIAVSLNVGGGVGLIKPAKLYMCMQTHYKQDEDGRTIQGVRSHGSVSQSHLGNVVTRTGSHTHLLKKICSCKGDAVSYLRELLLHPLPCTPIFPFYLYVYCKMKITMTI